MNHFLWCLCWCVSRLHFSPFGFFLLVFLFLLFVPKPPLFAFQFHVIAIVTLACTLLGHHWSMLTGRYNLIGCLSERRKANFSLCVTRHLHHAHSSSQQFDLFCYLKSCDHNPHCKDAKPVFSNDMNTGDIYWVTSSYGVPSCAGPILLSLGRFISQF